jgi:Rad52/22 family double-strand break repair protein
MGFSSRQAAALRRNVGQRDIRTRQSNGRELRPTLKAGTSSHKRTASSALTAGAGRRSNSCLAVRTAATSHGLTIIEGHGTAEGCGEFSGEVHGAALKAAKTDPTKRALATFERPFGLELYRGSQPAKSARRAEQVRPGRV